MHLAVLIVYGDILVQALGDCLIVYYYLFFARLGIDNEFQNIEEFAAVSAGLAEQGLGFLNLYFALFQNLVAGKRSVQKYLKVSDIQTLQYIHLTPGQKGSDDLERRVLCCRAYQHNRAGFHGPE